MVAQREPPPASAHRALRVGVGVPVVAIEPATTGPAPVRQLVYYFLHAAPQA